MTLPHNMVRFCGRCGRSLRERGERHCKSGSLVQCKPSRLIWTSVEALSEDELKEVEDAMRDGYLPDEPRKVIVRLLATIRAVKETL